MVDWRVIIAISLGSLFACSGPDSTSPDPRMTLTLKSVALSAPMGSTIPSTQVDVVQNSGGGTLYGLEVGQIFYGDGQHTEWFNATLSGTTAPATLTLSALAKDLIPGTYAATVMVLSPFDSAQTVSVTFAVTPTTPLINLSLPTVGFSATAGGPNPAAQTDSVHNGGVGTLNGLTVGVISYQTGQPMGWLSATLSGVTAPAALTLAPTTGSLGVGQYMATVYVIASGIVNSPQAVGVTFTVNAPPSISLRKESVRFVALNGGPDPAMQTDSVVNGGVGTLSGLALGTIAYGAGQPTGWLNAGLSATTAPAALTLNATTGSLAIGTYTAKVPLTATGAPPETLDVTTIVSPSAFAALSTSGYSHTCGVTPSGDAYCWGDNSAGELGDGSTTGLPVTVPVAVGGGLTFSTVSAGGYFTCGVAASGAAYCWGQNGQGQAGDGTMVWRDTPVAVAGGLSFSSVSAGGSSTCGLTTSGAAYCWGYNYNGQLGDGTNTTRLAPVAVAGGLTFAAVSVGGQHACGITTSGAVYCWGGNDDGQVGDGSTNPRWTPVQVVGGLTFAAVSAGGRHTCGVTTTNVAYCWGNNFYGQLGDRTMTSESSPIPVAGGLAFSVVDGGALHTCGLTSTGAAYCWGRNSSSQLGDGTTTIRLAPVAVAGGLTFAALSVGADDACGITMTGAAYCWGYNYNGQLGDGTTADRNTPVRVQ